MKDGIYATAGRVRELREKLETGLLDARQLATGEAVLDAIERAENMDDVRMILRRIALDFYRMERMER